MACYLQTNKLWHCSKNETYSHSKVSIASILTYITWTIMHNK